MTHTDSRKPLQTQVGLMPLAEVISEGLDYVTHPCESMPHHLLQTMLKLNMTVSGTLGLCWQLHVRPYAFKSPWDIASGPLQPSPLRRTYPSTAVSKCLFGRWRETKESGYSVVSLEGIAVLLLLRSWVV
jgi:hypothetical protein